MTFYLWNFMYNLIAICLAIAVAIMIYKIYIISKSDTFGIAREG